MHAYQEVSDVAFEVFSHYSPFVEGVSVDEAFLDVTGTVHLFGDMRTLAERLRAEIKAACGVTCSVGLAPNRLLAKIASEQNKPDGLFIMPFKEDAIRAFLAPQPVKILWVYEIKKMSAFIKPSLIINQDTKEISDGGWRRHIKKTTK